MHKILVYLHIIHLLKSSTYFEHYPSHLQEVYVVIVYMQPLVSSPSAGDCLVHRLRKNVLYVNKQEFCASSWRSTRVIAIVTVAVKRDFSTVSLYSIVRTLHFGFWFCYLSHTRTGQKTPHIDNSKMKLISII
jgi:hypothetical protein